MIKWWGQVYWLSPLYSKGEGTHASMEEGGGHVDQLAPLRHVGMDPDIGREGSGSA